MSNWQHPCHELTAPRLGITGLNLSMTHSEIQQNKLRHLPLFFAACRETVGRDYDGLDEQQPDAVVADHGRAHRHRPSPRYHRCCHHHRYEGTTQTWSVLLLSIIMLMFLDIIMLFLMIILLFLLFLLLFLMMLMLMLLFLMMLCHTKAHMQCYLFK
jgi:hypothetical protein